MTRWDQTEKGKAWKAEYQRKWKGLHPHYKSTLDKSTPERRKERNLKIRARLRKDAPLIRELVNFYKEVFGCVDCGENDPRVLDFHHVGEKSSALRRLHWSVAALSKKGFEQTFREIRKCIVLCANCHRKRARK